ncbi:MAG: L,D-transpeptidase [Hyphomicrobiaceae bacterium]|nr:MAG: L,D-transpeptidase [Hyphomicrobiaceae bacterium]
MVRGGSGVAGLVFGVVCGAVALATVGTAEAQYSREYYSRRSQDHYDNRRGEYYLGPRARPTEFFSSRYYAEPRRKKPLSRAVRELKPAVVEQAKKIEGQLQIVISIPHQRLTLYANGQKVDTAPVSTGQKGYPTPKGIFNIIQKARYHRSNIYSGAPMPFMQRITWSGVALHAGHLPGYPASHGCIRLPAAFAQHLFGVTKLGARVVVANDDVAPQDIQHPTLAALKAKKSEPVKGTKSSLLKTSGTTTDAPVEAVPVPVPAERTKVAENTPEQQIASNTPPEEKGQELVAPELKSDPITIFVSRKLGRIYVRQGFTPLFDGPVTIKNPELPLGNHVFTALEPNAAGTEMRWNVITLPGETIEKANEQSRRPKKKGERVEERPVEAPRVTVTAQEALERVDISPEVLEELSEFMRPGSSIIITDHGFGPETGKSTDFIVVTR